MITKEPNEGAMVTLEHSGKKELAMFTIRKGIKGFVTQTKFIVLTEATAKDLKW